MKNHHGKHHLGINMQNYIYVAILEGRPLCSSLTFKGLKEYLDEIEYAVNRPENNAVYLGYTGMNYKYPEPHEGYFQYQTTWQEKVEIDRIDVYIIDLTE